MNSKADKSGKLILLNLHGERCDQQRLGQTSSSLSLESSYKHTKDKLKISGTINERNGIALSLSFYTLQTLHS